MTGRCRRCGEKILFIRGRDHANYCVDQGLVPYWNNPKGRYLILTNKKEVIHCDLDGEPQDIADLGHVLHWMTCDNGGQNGKTHEKK